MKSLLTGLFLLIGTISCNKNNAVPIPTATANASKTIVFDNLTGYYIKTIALTITGSDANIKSSAVKFTLWNNVVSTVTPYSSDSLVFNGGSDGVLIFNGTTGTVQLKYLAGDPSFTYQVTTSYTNTTSTTSETGSIQ